MCELYELFNLLGIRVPTGSRVAARIAVPSHFKMLRDTYVNYRIYEYLGCVRDSLDHYRARKQESCSPVRCLNDPLANLTCWRIISQNRVQIKEVVWSLWTDPISFAFHQEADGPISDNRRNYPWISVYGENKSPNSFILFYFFEKYKLLRDRKINIKCVFRLFLVV